MSELEIIGGSGWVYFNAFEHKRREYLASTIDGFNLANRTKDAIYFSENIKKENEGVTSKDRFDSFLSQVTLSAAGSANVSISSFIHSDSSIILVKATKDSKIEGKKNYSLFRCSLY